MTRGLGGSLLPYRVRDFHSLFLASFPGARPDPFLTPFLYPPLGLRFQRRTESVEIFTINCRTNSPTLSSTEKSPWCLLGRPLSRNSCRKWRTSHAMYGLYRSEYGSSRSGESSSAMGLWRVFCFLFPPPRRYRLVDIKAVLALTGMRSLEEFQQNHQALIRKALYQPFQRQERWTKALALGSRSFVESFAQQARPSPKRRMLVTEEGFEIREDAPVFGKIPIEDKVLWGNNTFLWDAQEPENP